MTTSPLKVYDARWETGDFSSREIETLFQSSCVYARRLDINSVVISRDARLGCPDIVEIAVYTAQKAGLNVYLCQDPISTPQSYYHTLRVTESEPGTMGWTITASHNPASYVGVKFVVPPVRAIGMESGPLQGLSEIQRIYSQGIGEDFCRGTEKGRLRLIHFTDDYIKDSMTWAGTRPGDLRGMKVILNSLNGSAGSEMYRALDTAGVDVTALHLIVNGNFPAGAPNPISKGKMDDAVRLAGEYKDSIVIGLDGDGDRIVFGDQNGLYSAGTAMIAILTGLRHIEGTISGRALCDPKVAPPSLDYWNRLGFMPALFRNGHSQIKDYMLHHDIAIAAEESGHYYHKIKRGNITVYCENSILTVLLFLKAVRDDPILLSKMREVENSVYSTGEMNYQFRTDSDRDKAISLAVSQAAGNEAVISRATTDGIDLQGIAFIKGINPATRRIEDADWYSGFYRVSTNEKSVARFFLNSGNERVINELSRQLQIICEEELCGIKVE